MRPFSSDTPRPAGESLRLQIGELNIDAMSHFILLWLIALLGIFILFQKPAEKVDPVETWKIYASLGVLIGSSISELLTARKLRVLLVKLRSYNLGYDGERHVGQALNRLMLRGYTVYHDLVFEKAGQKFNIDHVVIGEKGIFAIETKTRRKPIGEGNKKLFKVSYDGKSLGFPNGNTEEPIRQILASRNFLSEWLTGRIGKPVSVEPIIVIPGWWIDATTQKPVVVMTDKAIDKFPFDSNRQLDTQTFNQVDFVLREHNSESLN